tara:strand:- start:5767 stop:7878 length:2112 start_codon:yes stop_codon:yes gene_type:complete
MIILFYELKFQTLPIKVKQYFILFICSFLLFSCTDDDSNEEVVQTEPDQEISEPLKVLNFELELEVFDEGGILLEASADELDATKITEYGFLISQFENLTFENSRIIESDGLDTNMFTQNVENDLDFNKEYYAVAYIKQAEKYAYTKAESFVSTGSKTPEIRAISQAHIGDTLEIRGVNFSALSNRIKVLFDEEQSVVLESSDTIIKCIVPESLKIFDPNVSVELFNKSTNFDNFSLYRPAIESISNTLVSIGDTLTVYGKHFDFQNQRNSVIIEERQAEILFSSRDSITFVLPQPLSFSNNSFILNSQLQNVASEISFTIKSPIINETPLSFRSFETIEIMGDEFSPNIEDNIVLFDGHEARILEATKTKLMVRVPIGPYDDKNPILQIKVMDQVYQFEEDLEFIDTWLLYKELPDSYFSHFIDNNNTAYVFTEDDTNSRFLVKTMDSDLNLLSSFNVNYPRTSMRDEPYSILFNKDSNRVFFYFGEEEEHNFYELLMDTNMLVERANYPDTLRTGPAIFTIDGLIYMGLGNYYGSNPYGDYEAFSHFWTYNDQTDIWIRVADFPGNLNRRDSSVFVINNKGYVGNGATSTGHYDFWKFSPVANEWIRIDNFPDIRKNSASFEYNGNGYVIFGGWLSSLDDVFKYVPNIDDWLELEDINEFYFQDYGRAPEKSTALKFSNAIYLIVNKYPKDLCFKVDLGKL